MKAVKHFPTLFIAIGLLIALSGCTSQHQYQYESIIKDYSDLTCNLAPVTGKPVETAACSLDEVIGIADAIKIARINNPDILMAASRIRRSEALMEQSRASFYPYVGFYSEYLQGDAPSAYLFKTIDARKLPPGTDFNNPGWFENFESGLTASINLYNGGKDLLSQRMAEVDLAVSQLDHQAVENALLSSVIRAYYDTLAALQFIRTAEESVKTVESQLRVMNVRFRSGGALKSDILSLEVRLAEAQESVVQARNRHLIAMAALANILGVQPDMPLKIADEKLTAPQVPGKYEAGIGYALQFRPELFKAREHLRKSRMAIDAAQGGYLPRVDFQTRYYVDDPAMDYDLDRENWTAGIFLNWDIFNGFSTRSEVRKANAALEEMLAADRKAVLSVKFDVRKAYLNLDEADQRLNVARSKVDTAAEVLSLVKKQYEGGSVTITRYLETELASNRAKIALTAAFYDKQKALADIGRAVGYWSRTAREK